MPLKVAFWNINTGKGSPQTRRTTLGNWCAEMNLDLLFLEEVSHTMRTSLDTLTGMQSITSAATLTRKRGQSTKELWALQRNTLDFTGRPLRMMDLTSIRMCLKVQSPTYGFAIWSLHANASSSGGRAAVKSAKSYLDSYPDNIIGGDFNRSFNATDVTKAIRSEAWDAERLKFTQWRKEYGRQIAVPDDDLHLQTMHCGYLKPIPSANGVIDFVMYGDNRTVTRDQNCLTEGRWVDILKNFDHCPVVYNIA